MPLALPRPGAGEKNSKPPTKLPEDILSPKPPPWPSDDSHVTKTLTKLPDDVVEPKLPPWPPDDDAFEAEPATKPLDVSQHVLLTEPPDKIYAQYGFPILHFLTAPFFESAVHPRTWCLSALSFVFISLYALCLEPLWTWHLNLKY